jgi:hypothetical protein
MLDVFNELVPTTFLHKYFGCPDILAFLLEEGFGVLVDELHDEWTALDKACSIGKSEGARMLLRAGTSVVRVFTYLLGSSFVRLPNGKARLFEALGTTDIHVLGGEDRKRASRLGIVFALAAQGVDAETQDVMKPLWTAAFIDDPEFQVPLWAEAEADELLEAAVFAGSASVVRRMIRMRGYSQVDSYMRNTTKEARARLYPGLVCINLLVLLTKDLKGKPTQKRARLTYQLRLPTEMWRMVGGMLV